MNCPTCAAATLAPIIEGGVSIRKITERAVRSVTHCDKETRSAVQLLADTANYLAAEAAMAKQAAREEEGGEP